jgi:hypothetical protein
MAHAGKRVQIEKIDDLQAVNGPSDLPERSLGSQMSSPLLSA